MSTPSGNGLFVDTAGWAGIVLQNGPDYQAMEAFYKRTIAVRREFVTTNYVLSELIALLTARSRAPRRQDDKDWSLVDAVSFVIMRQLGLREAFTSDHHFSQAGFVRVPS